MKTVIKVMSIVMSVALVIFTIAGVVSAVTDSILIKEYTVIICIASIISAGVNIATAIINKSERKSGWISYLDLD